MVVSETSASVELTFVVDAFGKSPFLNQARSIEVPIKGSHMKIELTDPCYPVARVAQGLVVGRLVKRIILLIVDYPAAAIASA